MDNGNASMKHPISNNYKESEMHSSNQDTKSIEEKLSESSNVRGVSTTISDQPVNIDDEEKQVSDQPTAQMPLQVEGESEFEGKRDSPSPESSASGGSSSSSFVNVSTSNRGVTDSSNGEYVKVEDIVEDTALKDTGNPQDIQPEILISKPSSTGTKGGKKKQTPVQPAKDIAQIDDDDDYDLSWLFSEEGDQVPHPKNLEPEPTLSLTSKKSERVNNTTPQNTESSNLHIISASALAIVVVTLEVAIAVHLEMLAVGILVGAYCLVAAAVICCCGPRSSVKDSKIEKIASNEKKEPLATSV